MYDVVQANQLNKFKGKIMFVPGISSINKV